MHGRPRKSQSEEEQAASATKAAQLRSLQSQFLQFHHSKTFTKEALEVSAKLLTANPEHYTAWNYRKLAVEDRVNRLESVSPESIKSILDEELRLVENALRKNYKSYGAWHHRKWVLRKGQSSTDHELLLLNQFQKADARNFHAWNYRRFITELKNIPYKEELQYTTDMIDDNFSNYSAWHNRSVILSQLSEKRAEGYFPKKDFLIEEYNFVRDALFIDPDDQSGWFYHFWLIDQTTRAESLSVLSWPSHGSSIYVSKDGSPNNSALSPFCIYRSNTRIFPVVLYFSEPVKGVDSSTVTVEYDNGASIDLTWTPLSADIKCCAQAWIAYLNLPEDELPDSMSFQVNVSLINSDGIVSLSCINHCQPFNISFTVHLPSYKPECVQGPNERRISWCEENFYEEETEVKNYRLCDFFHQMSVNQDEKTRVSEWKLETIASEITHCRDLLSTVDCKIGKLTLARLLMSQHSLTSRESSGESSCTDYEEVLQLYNELISLDPPHSQYYKDHYSSVLLKQVISDNRFVEKYCRRYRDSTSPSTDWGFCLRLNNLSLTRIGAVEQLLWVQMLDLSHNQLRSIEGLEAMQLLSCLNLSHNKLCSFTALEPLRLLKSLEVLDISHNEIGEHSIDSRRHLCSSPITHTAGSGWNFDQYVANEPEMTNRWDAYAIFKDLNLIQLDILGDAVADEKLKMLLHTLMPKLKWLDGETLR